MNFLKSKPFLRLRLPLFSGFILMVFILSTSPGIDDKKTEMVVLSTDYGDITLLLYEETPLHKENFLKLVRSGFYNETLFHRVINGFMIQGGDPGSKNAAPEIPLGTGGPGYTIEAEFRDQFIHKKGALAAARQGDQVNPEKKSSGSQFYIVQGKKITTQQLEQTQANRRRSGLPDYTAEQIELYRTIGGTPHLDGAYTVFGEVIDGLDVIDSIAAQKTDRANRPLKDVVINMKIEKRRWP